jgi:hypothetical protein
MVLLAHYYAGETSGVYMDHGAWVGPGLVPLPKDVLQGEGSAQVGGVSGYFAMKTA